MDLVNRDGKVNISKVTEFFFLIKGFLINKFLRFLWELRESTIYYIHIILINEQTTNYEVFAQFFYDFIIFH